MDLKEKQLLLADLCARLPYNVKCKVHLDTKGYCLRDEDKYCDDTLESVNCKKQTCTFNKSIGYNFGYFAIEEVKPYLRSMSSMTEEEKEELKKLFDAEEVTIDSLGFTEGGILEDYISQVSYDFCGSVTDWLLAHHFDYRFPSLIGKGLALEAPKGMY